MKTSYCILAGASVLIECKRNRRFSATIITSDLLFDNSCKSIIEDNTICFDLSNQVYYTNVRFVKILR